MRPVLWGLLLAAAAAVAAALLGRAVAHAGPPALVSLHVVPLPGVQHRIDHMAVDVAGQRLFVAALGNHSLEVVDLAGAKRVASIGGLNEPQGVAYVPSLHRIVAATRSGGTVTAYDDKDYRPVGSLARMPDADNLRLDGATGLLYVGHGDGALGVIDPASMKLLADIPLPGHPESFRLEERGPRIFVNVPPAGAILIVDRVQRAVVGRIPVAGASENYPMALDEPGHRLFVGVRKPARLLVFDTATSQPLASVPCVGDTDDLFYDARRDRVMVIGGQGTVDVFDAGPTEKYAGVARLVTRSGARTGLWSAELDQLFVACPLRENDAAEIQVFGPLGP